jgi:hypothetical protein
MGCENSECKVGGREMNNIATYSQMSDAVIAYTLDNMPEELVEKFDLHMGKVEEDMVPESEDDRNHNEKASRALWKAFEAGKTAEQVQDIVLALTIKYYQEKAELLAGVF